MENSDDIFKQMNRDMNLIKEIVDGGQEEEDGFGELIEPRVVSQREDVIYIKNPPRDWAFNRVLTFSGDKMSAITLSLQKQ